MIHWGIPRASPSGTVLRSYCGTGDECSGKLDLITCPQCREARYLAHRKSIRRMVRMKLQKRILVNQNKNK